MSYLVAALMDFICRDNELSKENYKIYQYGLQACVEMMFCLLTCFVIAIKMEMLREFVMFFGIFISTRSYIGGIHMKSYWLCFIMSCSIFSLVLYLTKYFAMGNLQSLLLFQFSLCVIYFLERSGGAENDISNEERMYFRKKMNITFRVWVIIFTILFLFRFTNLLALSAYTFASVMLSKFAELIKNKVQE